MSKNLWLLHCCFFVLVTRVHAGSLGYYNFNGSSAAGVPPVHCTDQSLPVKKTDLVCSNATLSLGPPFPSFQSVSTIGDPNCIFANNVAVAPSFSISFWYRKAAPVSGDYLFGFGDFSGAGNNGYAVWITFASCSGTGVVKSCGYITSIGPRTEATDYRSSARPYDTTAYHHYVLTYDNNANGALVLMYDGSVLSWTNPLPFAAIPFSGNGRISPGGDANAERSFCYSADFSTIVVMDRVISNNEMIALYQGGLPCFGNSSFNTQTVCSGFGSCTAPDYCQCNSGHTGSQCDTWYCNGNVCSKHGLCIASNNCSCTGNYYGAICNLYNCNNIASNGTGVCNSRGSCIAPDTCTCTTCFAGNDCEWSYCNPRPINTTSSQALRANESQNITLTTSFIPSVVLPNISCAEFTSTGVFISLVPTSNSFTCLFNSPVSYKYIGLVYRLNATTNYTISSNFIPVFFVQRSNMSLANGYYDFGLTGKSSYFGFVFGNNTTHPSEVTPFVRAKVGTEYYTVTNLTGNVYLWYYLAGSDSQIDVSLVIMFNNASELPISTTTIRIQFFTPGILSFASGSAAPAFNNGGDVTNGTKATFLVPLALQTSKQQSFETRIRCIAGSDPSTAFNAASIAYSNGMYTFTCSVTINTPGTFPLGVYIQSLPSSSLPPVLVSTTTVPVVGVEKLVITSQITPAPFVVHDTSSKYTFEIALGFYITRPGSVGSAYNYTQGARYFCVYGNGCVGQGLLDDPGIWDGARNTVTCTINAPQNPGQCEINVQLLTNDIGTPVQLNAGAGALLTVFRQSNIVSIDQFVKMYNTTSITSSAVTLGVTSGSIYSCNNMYMGYSVNGTVSYSPAQCSGDSVTGRLNITSMSSQNATAVILGLVYMYNNTVLAFTSNTVNQIFVAGPIGFLNAPSVFDRVDLNGTSYNLNFNVPAYVGPVSFAVAAQQKGGASIALTCNVAGNVPYCILAPITPFMVPVRLDFVITFTYNGPTVSSSPVQFAMTPHYYREAMNINSVVPFFSDTLNTVVGKVFWLRVPIKLNPNFTYKIRRTNSTLGISTEHVATTTIEDLRWFNTTISSLGVDHVASLTLVYVNTTESNEYNLDLSKITNGAVASTVPSTLEFNTLSMLSPYMDGQERAATNFTLVYNNTIVPYIVPSAYRTTGVNAAITFPIPQKNLFFNSFINADGAIGFTKSIDITPGLTVVEAITLQVKTQASIISGFSPFVSLSTLSTQEVLFRKSDLVSKYPIATLRGTSPLVVFAFSGTVSSISIPYSYKFFAKLNSSTTQFDCTPGTSNTMVQCQLLYSASYLTSNFVSLLPYFTVLAFSGDVPLYTASSNLELGKLYYIDKGLISLDSSTPQRFLFTVSYSTILVRFNSTAMPPIDTQQKYINCVYSFDSQKTFSALAGVVQMSDTLYVYNCTAQIPLNYVGTASLSIWYKEDSLTYGTNVQISNNTIPVVFTDQIRITSASPSALRTNVTKTISLATSFVSSVSYGPASYYVSISSGANSVLQPLTSIDNGYFTFLFMSSLSGVVNLNIIMEATGYNATINTVSVPLTLVNGNYFTPSYGNITGGVNITMENYDGPKYDLNVTFKDDSSTYFKCAYDAMDNVQNCLTPKVNPPLLPFKSYVVVLNGTDLPIKYVTIDTRTITSNALVFPTGQLVSVTLTFNQEVTFNSFPSATVLQLRSSTGEFTDIFSNLTSTTSVTRNFQLATANTYDMTLLYQNPDIIESFSYVAFTNSISVQLVAPIKISFGAGTTSMGIMNSFINVTVDFAANVTTSIQQHLECRLNNGRDVFKNTPTILSGTKVICRVSNPVAEVAQLSIWYTESMAYNGSFQMSSNSLSILFMERISSTSIPWATTRYGVEVPITLVTNLTTSTTFASDVYYNCTTYDQANGEIRTPKAVQSEGTFTCSIYCQATGDATHSLVSVDLYAYRDLFIDGAKFTETILITAAPTVVYFFAPVTQNYLSPFVNSIGSSLEVLNVSISVSTPSIVTDRDLYCKYSSNDHQSWLYTPATRTSSTGVKCSLSVIHTQSIETVDVRLWYNAASLPLTAGVLSPLSFDYSTTNISMLHIQQPLSFNDVVNMPYGILDKSIANGKYITLNYTEPSGMTGLTVAYSVQVTRDNLTDPLLCNVIQGQNSSCLIVPTATVLRSPTTFTYTITLKTSRESFTWNMLPNTYYEAIDIKKAYPYILSGSEYSVVNTTISFTTDILLNELYNYYCVVQSSKGSYRSVVSIVRNNLFTCQVRSFNALEQVRITLQYEQPATIYYGTSRMYNFSTNFAGITFTEPLQIGLPLAPAPTDGSFVVYTTTPFPSEPTTFATHSDYTQGISIMDRGTSISLLSCTLVNPAGSTTIKCLLPSGLSFPKYPWYSKMVLTQMGTRAVPLAPNFEFYRIPTFTSMVPAVLVPIGESVPTADTVIYGSNFIKDGYTSITYACSGNICATKVGSQSSQTSKCNVQSPSVMTCSPPQFVMKSVASLQTPITVSIVMANTSYATGLTITLYKSSEFSIADPPTVPQSVDPLVSSTLSVKGSGFINKGNNIWVKFSDKTVYSYITQDGVKFVSSGEVTIQTPTLWHVDFNYPKEIDVWISTDSGTNFLPVYSIMYKSTAQLTFYPYSFANNSHVLNMTIGGLPNITIPSGRQMRYELYDGATYTGAYIVCANGYNRCSTINSPWTPPSLPLSSSVSQLQIVPYSVSTSSNATDRVRMFIPVKQLVQLYTVVTVTGIVPAQVILTVTNRITLIGDFTVLQGLASVPVYVQIGTGTAKPLQLVSLTATSMVISGLSTVEFSDYLVSLPQTRNILATQDINIFVNVPGSDSGSIMLLTTSSTFGTSRMISAIPPYSISYVINSNNNFYQDYDTAYTFQATNITVNGTGFPTNAVSDSIRVVFKTQLFTVPYTINKVGLVVKNQNTISMVAPMMVNLTADANITAPIALNYPLSVSLGISFNYGVDYVYRTIQYMSSFRPPLLTSIVPFIAPRTALNITVGGKYLTLATFCMFESPYIQTYYAPVVSVKDGDGVSDFSVMCYLPAYIGQTPNVKELNMTILTGYSQNSTALVFTYHETLNISGITPVNGTTAGNIPVFVTSTGIEPESSGFDLYVRFSELISTTPCTYVANATFSGTTTVNCTVLSHANGLASVMLSYDQVHWYMQGGTIYDSDKGLSSAIMNYNYIPCDVGYSAPDFSTPCTACPPGTYKTTAGIYNCIPCVNGTYNEFYAQKNCTICPINTSSKDKSTGYYDCVCNPGYYTNPLLTGPRCISCPTGGDCSQFNTTIPPALYGYWHAESDPYNFKKCFPENACPGGGFRNCSVGYDSRASVCGLCNSGYYKWRNNCTECGPGAWYKALLAAFGLVIVTMIFFAISSAKVSHLSSLSIAFSYWQIISLFASFDVNWPSVVSGTFTAASITNLNVDFLSPQCIFPEMNFVSKWVVVTLLPFYFLVAFIILYIIGEIRTLIVNRTGKYVRIKYIPFREEPEYDAPNPVKKFVVGFIISIPTLLLNMLIWLYNACIWFLKAGATRDQMRNFRNKIINSYSAFLSFIYLFVMSQASQIFVCTIQPDGTSTLNSSPDIICFVGYGDWPKLLSLSIIIYAIFGIGAIFFFLGLFLYQRYMKRRRARIMIARAELEIQLMKEAELEGNEEPLENIIIDNVMYNKLNKQLSIVEQRVRNFNMRFKFMLSRFKNKYFFWEAVITGRKLAISILNTFLKPMLVIVFGIVIMFIAMILHMRYVPFRYKFHNLMEYVVLVATNVVLLLGLLFFVDSFPTEGWKQFAIWLATIVIILSVVFVVIMIVFDIVTRRLKDKRLVKQRKEELVKRFGEMKKEQLEKEYKKMFPSAFSTKTREVDEMDEDWQEDPEWQVDYNGLLEGVEWRVIPNPLVEDSNNSEEIDYQAIGGSTVVDFSLPFYNDDESMSDEGKHETINDIMDDLFGVERIRKKVLLLKQIKNFKKIIVQKQVE